MTNQKSDLDQKCVSSYYSESLVSFVSFCKNFNSFNLIYFYFDNQFNLQALMINLLTSFYLILSLKQHWEISFLKLGIFHIYDIGLRLGTFKDQSIDGEITAIEVT